MLGNSIPAKITKSDHVVLYAKYLVPKAVLFTLSGLSYNKTHLKMNSTDRRSATFAPVILPNVN